MDNKESSLVFGHFEAPRTILADSVLTAVAKTNKEESIPGYMRGVHGSPGTKQRMSDNVATTTSEPPSASRRQGSAGPGRRLRQTEKKARRRC